MDMEALEPDVRAVDKTRLGRMSLMKTECHCPLCEDHPVVGVGKAGIPCTHLRKVHPEVDFKAFRAEWKDKLDTWEREATEEELEEKLKYREANNERRRKYNKKLRDAKERAEQQALKNERRYLLDPLKNKPIKEYVAETKSDMDRILEAVSASVPDWSKTDVRPEERMFAALYITNGFNATYAYRAAFAGAKTEGGNHTSGIGNDKTPALFLQRPNVQKLINSYMATWISVKANELNYRLTKALMTMAFYDPADIIDAEGNPSFKRWEELSPEQRLCVKSIKTRYYGSHAEAKVAELEMTDRMDAMRVLSKFMVMMKEQMGHNVEKASSTMTPDTELMLRSILSGSRQVGRKKGDVEVV